MLFILSFNGMDCSFQKYSLLFRRPGGTSRGVLHTKDTYIVTMRKDGKIALGECNLFKGLSYDDRPDYEDKLQEICRRIPEEGENLLSELSNWPSIRFGMEMMLLDWQNDCKQEIFPQVIGDEGFSIPINGLIWMGPHDYMMEQVTTKLSEGYTSIKLKVGAIDFQSELELIRYIRREFSADEVEIRLDANGAFTPTEAKEKLDRLAKYGIHYIEQPIRAGQWQETARLVEDSPIKIALDEELIGINTANRQRELIETIRPAILILKPALLGGFKACDDWTALLEDIGGYRIITSALESNIGLNAIAQYAALTASPHAYGLGTGMLYSNNFPSPYHVDAQGLHYRRDQTWDFSSLT